MNPEKLTQWLKMATAPLLAAGSLFGAIWTGTTFLQPRLLETDIFNAFWAFSIAAALPALAAVLLLWASFRIVARRSLILRPECFDLRVRSRDDLFGRDDDAKDLCALVQDFSVVFVDGESGSGKSSLVAYGLMPLAREKTQLLPVLVSTYSGDWEGGLTRKTYEAIWSALNETDRARLKVSDYRAVGAIDVELIGRMLREAPTALGRKMLLIFDQFDDYQLAYRAQFLDERRTWIPAAALRAMNAFWRMVDEARAAGDVTLMFVVRSDANSGLHSVRFTESNAARSVLRLNATWLPRLLNQVSFDGGKGPVIENPDDGWADLKRLVELDLNRDGTILPQQVRVTLLGLRELKALTPGEYRRMGRAAGAEALYIRDAIRSAAAASGLDEREIRAVLLELIERGPTNTVKGRQRSGAELSTLIPDDTARGKALEHLKRAEIVRQGG